MNLAGLVATLRYKPGWAFRVGGPRDAFLCVFASTPDSLNPDRRRTTQHMFELPDVNSVAEFSRWLFDRLLECERHEVGEFLTVAGERPFYPHHADEGSPYVVVDRTESLWP